MTGWLTRHPATLTAENPACLKEVLARCPELDQAAGHVRDFGKILTDRIGSTLPTWIDAVDVSQLPGLTGFLLHLLRDLDAVTARTLSTGVQTAPRAPSTASRRSSGSSTAEPDPNCYAK
ncbi:hypothetical protein [Streptomyces celluloflavus]|uniref:hypothetical protein n=1 Tax=Streptomyces celluloflavus TaxID=58344 RepID=UPI0036885723